MAFFAEKHEFLKNWRNDVGGHFHDKAAEFAIDNIETETVGAIDVYRQGAGADDDAAQIITTNELFEKFGQRTRAGQ